MNVIRDGILFENGAKELRIQTKTNMCGGSLFQVPRYWGLGMVYFRVLCSRAFALLFSLATI